MQALLLDFGALCAMQNSMKWLIFMQELYNIKSKYASIEVQKYMSTSTCNKVQLLNIVFVFFPGNA